MIRYDTLAPSDVIKYLKRNLPPEVQRLKAFVVFRYTPPRTPSGKRGKVPYYANGNLNVRHGQHGTPADLARMATFEQACERFADPAHKFAGVGICALASNPCSFVDLDNCVDPANGQLTPLADELCEFNAYTEYSPSGHGLRLIVMPNLAVDAKNHTAGFEIFSHKGFVTLTGITLRANGH